MSTSQVIGSTHSRVIVQDGYSNGIRVSGNWRIVFRFEDGEAVDVDLIDYH